MSAPPIASRLESFRGRGAGTDAERRAAQWLADELSRGRREVDVETFWCRPNWAMAHSWHVALALAGSLTSVASARVGGALILASLVFTLMDALTGVSPGRRLTPERASQNVVASPPARAAGQPRRLRLVLTANYDTGRLGLVYRDPARRSSARIRRLTRGVTVGWLGWLLVALVWVEAIAILRLEGHHDKAVAIAQLPPTISLVLVLAALLELASAQWSPGGGDNASGVTALVAMTRALDSSPPANLDVEAVLTGAGDRDGIGLSRYLRAHRRTHRPANTAVIGLAAGSGGAVRWWRSDGELVPLRYSARMRRLAARLAAKESFLGAAGHDGRGRSAAFPARLARIPAIAIGCLDRDGLTPRSHQRGDLAQAIDESALEDLVQFGLMLVDEVDAAVAPPRGAPARASV